MSAQGIQPQSGSGAGEYEEWANSTQYGPEDWDEFEDMQDLSEYNDHHPDDENDCYCTEDYEGNNHSFATGHIMGSDLRPGEKFNHKTAPSFDGSMSWLLFCEVVKDWENHCDRTIPKRPSSKKPFKRIGSSLQKSI